MLRLILADDEQYEREYLEKIIKENGINIVHARSRAPAWSAYWAAKRAGVHYMTAGA